MLEPKYNIWKCYTCPAFCILPFVELYENPHVCVGDETIVAEFIHEEIGESELLKWFLKTSW